jgi:hypothetical protein
MTPPPLLPDVSLIQVALAGALNPAAIAVSYLMGRKADQLPKLLIAGFAGGAVAALSLYLAALVGIPGADNLSRALAGVFTVALVAGIFYGWIGLRSRSLNKP